MTDLPPRPDPITGEPFPPHAPVYPGRDKGDSRGRAPEPPPGMDRALAWYYDTRAKRWGFFGVAVVIIAVASSLMLWWFDEAHNPFLWTPYWQLWLIVLVFAFVWADPFAVGLAAAGGDWLALRKRRWFGLRKRNDWVRLYDLTAVEWTTVAGLGEGLYLTDDEDRIVAFSLDEVVDNRRVWDLIYNGILHSVADGAYINIEALGKLGIRVDSRAHDACVKKVGDIVEMLATDPDRLTGRDIALLRARPKLKQKVVRRNLLSSDAPLDSFREALVQEAKDNLDELIIAVAES